MYENQIQTSGYLLAYKITTGVNRFETRQQRIPAQNSKEAVSQAANYFLQHEIPTDDVISATLTHETERIVLAEKEKWFKKPKRVSLENRL